MRTFLAALGAALILTVAPCAAASSQILVVVKLHNGAPAKHAVVRMFTESANYLITILETKTADASGKAVFRLHPGACFKGEYGRDSQGRPLEVAGECPKGNQRTLTIVLN